MSDLVKFFREEWPKVKTVAGSFVTAVVLSLSAGAYVGFSVSHALDESELKTSDERTSLYADCIKTAKLTPQCEALKESSVAGGGTSTVGGTLSKNLVVLATRTSKQPGNPSVQTAGGRDHGPLGSVIDAKLIGQGQGQGPPSAAAPPPQIVQRPPELSGIRGAQPFHAADLAPAQPAPTTVDLPTRERLLIERKDEIATLKGQFEPQAVLWLKQLHDPETYKNSWPGPAARYAPFVQISRIRSELLEMQGKWYPTENLSPTPLDSSDLAKYWDHVDGEPTGVTERQIRLYRWAIDMIAMVRGQISGLSGRVDSELAQVRSDIKAAAGKPLR